MNRRLFALIIAIIILIPSISSYGVPIENVGTYHEDGSYQLSDEELVRYNNLYGNIKQTKSIISYADALKYIAPNYYNNLTSEMKEGLNHIKFGNSFVKNQKQGYIPYGGEHGIYEGTYGSISKDGDSLKGYGSFDRKVRGPSNPDYRYVYVINHIFDTNDNRVGISYNTKAWPSDSYISISATTIVDPPSGEYYDLAEFAIPEYCINHNDYKYVEPYVSTDSISYVNPYQ